MQIKLTDFGPSLWFLGDDPKNLLVYLTYLKPGPVEVDFFQLKDAEQIKVLDALKEETIESDITFESLFKEWSKSKKIQGPPLSENLEIEKEMKVEAKKREKDLKLEERCKYLSNKSLRAIKTALKGEKEIRVFRTLLRFERENKNRKTAISHLDNKIKGFEQKIAEMLNKPNGKVDSRYVPKETFPFSVVESEQEEIVLKVEDLVGAVYDLPEDSIF